VGRIAGSLAEEDMAMIRPATIEDADEVADLYIGSRRRHVTFAPPAHSDDAMRRWIRHVLIPRGGVLVLEDKGRIVAMMAVSRNEQGSWIDQLYVHPDNLSRGFGSELVAEAKSSLPSLVLLYTFQQNHRSRRFYERLGFVAVKFTDGSGNEERCPDVLYRWEEKSPNAVDPIPASRGWFTLNERPGQ
jgi:RimJ/RimL family protein N-acetyltransferase